MAMEKFASVTLFTNKDAERWHDFPKDFSLSERGGGFWAWKPLALLRIMEDTEVHQWQRIHWLPINPPALALQMLLLFLLLLTQCQTAVAHDTQVLSLSIFQVVVPLAVVACC
jgi:hypothetical protein